MSQYKDKHVAILGLSVEGIQSAIFLHNKGASVTCCDRREQKELDGVYQKLRDVVEEFRFGQQYLSDLDHFDILVRTPGMSPTLPELERAKKKGKTITSLTKLFFDHCRGTIVGITGTKGKGTVSTLVYEMVKKEGIRTWLGGNIGIPLLSELDHISSSDIVVLELSSFQLEDLHKSPHIAVVLKITQEHLANYDPLASNYHISKEAYIEAKKSICRFQSPSDFVICNADDATSSSFASLSKAKAYYFSRNNDAVDAYVKDGTVYLKWNNTLHTICSKDTVLLRGIHNLENIAAASVAGMLAGASIQSIQSTAQTFKGLEHRLELVRTIDGVSYYNDSFSTVPETTIAAIQSFDEPLILIVGGSDKGSDYSELGEEIAHSKVKVLFIIGAMTKQIYDAVKNAGYNGTIITQMASMHDIVQACFQKAKKGDVVLLSPACASFDMFKNYKERGRLFKYEVSRL